MTDWKVFGERSCLLPGVTADNISGRLQAAERAVWAWRIAHGGQGRLKSFKQYDAHGKRGPARADDHPAKVCPASLLSTNNPARTIP
jgi:hypothetical protein